jgi:hypothetical protein
MPEHGRKSPNAAIVLLTIGAAIALPLLLLFAALAEERLLGSHEVSSFCHRVGIDNLLDRLFWLIFGFPA